MSKCIHANKLHDNLWCSTACMYCTLSQEEMCRHRKDVPDTNVVKTIADQIRSMTDEELAKLSAYMMSRGDCWGCPWFWPCDYEKETCTKFFLDWLKQPYGGDT